MIRFGPWSTILGMAAGFGALVALLLLNAPGNRVANRLLAALLGVAVLRLMPYVLGFAGFYDAYPWLSFAPFNFALATGPLLYLYVCRLVTPRLSRGWFWHFAPAALNLLYTLWAFSLPLDDKTRWNDAVHARWIDPVQTWAGALSLMLYFLAAARFHAHYGRWLAGAVSNPRERQPPWQRTLLLALGLWLVVTVAFDAVDTLVAPLSYYDRFPQYLAFAAIVLTLGLEGWRHAGRAYPPMGPTGPEPEPPRPRGRDWTETATRWQAAIRREGWWREPGLTLAEVAQRLGTNETYLSRALNQGLGHTFSALVNGLRVEAVQARLRQAEPGDLLSVALDCGFASKASFNRVFRDHTGMSPSAWRAAQKAENGGFTGNEATVGGDGG
ncbi:helix-turn-helix domain-containing protein [Nitrospirillum amazonense]|uniref:AraC-like DNA-binding protein n=1 Tax=Nitrospirillum amazonense TaxID=28077 RepID=A0A560JQ91_9PROT|nr:AraC family transcriptional regulator [Nitrospirillum amazonense]MDG3442233.1 AraC family transcriptional regulator [Nitrospirillum amazonense]TWB73272.1 AraC-like DNA-binding protein [Nitrospirillum amazonense]